MSNVATRKTLKILHTVSAAGLIGGLFAYFFLIPVGTGLAPAELARTRGLIATLCNWALLPSLAIALVSGLIAMVAHTPFLDKGWVWIKALMGILMFKGVLLLVVAEANHAAAAAARMAETGAAEPLFTSVHYAEGWAVGVVLALSIANVIFGVWRPRIVARSKADAVARAAEERVDEGAGLVAVSASRRDMAA